MSSQLSLSPENAALSGTFDAIVIGAGFSGLYQLLRLRDHLKISVVVLEAGSGVGGTWFWNRYPGARCDSESTSYSYSFSEELDQEWNWTERYPEQPEIMRYLNHVADRFDLKRSIRFDTRVTQCRFDDAANRWRVITASGEELSCQFLITAVGCLSTANMPTIPGLGNFRGDWYHTGNWPHEGVDFSGKRVGLIGTGSTGIQATPVIAAQATHLTVFQRTANYSVPARNAPMTAEYVREVKANYPELRKRARRNTSGHHFDISERKVFDVSAEERQALFEQAWEIGGLRFRATFQDIMIDKRANDTAADFIRAKIKQIVKDPEVAERLTPRDHPFATKRPPIDSNYFETYNRDNVLLVDIRAAPIEEITASGVRTRDAEYPLDIIVFATGFDAMTGPLLALDITGKDGRSLKDAWSAGPTTYLGLQIEGFPNLFTVTGPGSPSVLSNMPVAIEQHVNWITDCVAYLRSHDRQRIETTAAAVEGWVAHVNEAANATLMPEAGSSWYLGANVPGKPRVFMPYPGGMARYAAVCSSVAAEGYQGFVLS